MKQANEKNQEWKDARDVKKALIEWDKETIPFTIRQYLEHPFDRSFTPEQMIDFAKFYAQRCGVVLDGNSEIPNNHKCDHPYHSVVGGNGSPERCLTCGKVLSI